MIHRRGAGHGVAVYDPQTKRMRWIGTYPSEAEARQAEAEATRRISAGRVDYPTRWLAERPRRAVGTRRLYARAVKLFRERFNECPLPELDAAEVWAWATGLERTIAVAVQTMFSDAVRDGAHPGPNPLRSFSGAHHGGRRPGRLSQDDAYRLAECAVEAWGSYGLEVLAPAILTTAFGRLTRRELFDLRPDAVDGDILRIRRGVEVDEYRLPPELAEQLRIRAERGDEWMFQTIRGLKLTPGTHYRYWSVIRVAYGNPDMQFYEVRLEEEPPSSRS